MSCVQKTVKIGSLPTRHDVEADSQGCADPSRRPKVECVREAALDARDGRAWQAREAGDVLLAKTLPDPDSPDHLAEPEVVHRPSVGPDGRLPVIADSSVGPHAIPPPAESPRRAVG